MSLPFPYLIGTTWIMGFRQDFGFLPPHPFADRNHSQWRFLDRPPVPLEVVRVDVDGSVVLIGTCLPEALPDDLQEHIIEESRARFEITLQIDDFEGWWQDVPRLELPRPLPDPC